MRIILVTAALLITTGVFAQNISGSFESNSQLYLDDPEKGTSAPQDALRSNNYFTLQYDKDAFSIGVQYEAYLPDAPLLGFDPALSGQGIATYFAQYKKGGYEITAGYFYEQFGNGLALRSWEDRQLGLNNAIQGVRVQAGIAKNLTLKALYGKIRHGFEMSEGTLQAADLSYDLSPNWQFGGSVVSRYIPHTNPDENFPSYVNIYAGRAAWFGNSISLEATYLYKTPDLSTGVPGAYFSGSALQLDANYSTKGFAASASFRRLENFGFYADRTANQNQYNAEVVNYLPALTKQMDFGLQNIYVYQAQPFLVIPEEKAGEIGGQIDLFYTFDKNSSLGKYKTKLAFNYSYWSQIDAEFSSNDYVSNFGFGTHLYDDLNLEIRNKWSKKWSTIINYQTQFYNKGIIEGGTETVNTQIIVAEATRKYTKGKSLQINAQHLWTEDDRGNWFGAGAEFYLNRNWSVFANDLYNYEYAANEHYFNGGMSYKQKGTRVAASFGRQRGGLMCIGGICRFVPENYGFSLNLSTSF